MYKIIPRGLSTTWLHIILLSRNSAVAADFDTSAAASSGRTDCGKEQETLN
jgi:hypothetical protein